MYLFLSWLIGCHRQKDLVLGLKLSLRLGECNKPPWTQRRLNQLFFFFILSKCLESKSIVVRDATEPSIPGLRGRHEKKPRTFSPVLSMRPWDDGLRSLVCSNMGELWSPCQGCTWTRHQSQCWSYISKCRRLFSKDHGTCDRHVTTHVLVLHFNFLEMNRIEHGWGSGDGG